MTKLEQEQEKEEILETLAQEETKETQKTEKTLEAELNEKLEEQKERYLRLLAEYDNYRKRTAREISDAKTNAKISVIGDLLAVFDYLAMASEHADAPNANLDTIRQGLQMIFNQYYTALEGLGITKIDAVGEVFNPLYHEAVSQETSDTVQSGHVLKQWKCGYKMKDRLIRPATVVVSSGPQTQETTEAGTENSAPKTEDTTEDSEA